MDKKLIKSQVGCGYCVHETTCTKRDPKVNKAKLGCEDYKHFKLNETKELKPCLTKQT